MKKRSPVLAILILLMVMTLGIGSAMASYDPWCTANYSEGSYDEDANHAFSGNTLYYAESRADGWVLGSQAYVYVDPDTSFSGSLSAYSRFFQEFVVTGAGDATITFSYDGTLSAQNYGTGTIEGMYSMDFWIAATDDYGYENEYYDDGSLEEEGLQSYSDTFSFNYTFTADDVGSTFKVYLELEANIDAEYIDYYVDEEEGQFGDAEFMSDFYTTAELVGYSGGIAPLGGPPVPIPGAVWLLGSGLIGLVAFGGRRRKKNMS